jgi:hypothetical protein
MDSVVVTAVPPVARMVSLAGQRTALGPAHYFGLVGALLDTVHRVREGSGHLPGGGHVVNPPRPKSAGGARHGVTRLRKRALLLERSAIIAEKLVSWH